MGISLHQLKWAKGKVLISYGAKVRVFSVFNLKYSIFHLKWSIKYIFSVTFGSGRELVPIRIGCLNPKRKIPKLSLMTLKSLKDEGFYFICIENFRSGSRITDVRISEVLNIELSYVKQFYCTTNRLCVNFNHHFSC